MAAPVKSSRLGLYIGISAAVVILLIIVIVMIYYNIGADTTPMMDPLPPVDQTPYTAPSTIAPITPTLTEPAPGPGVYVPPALAPIPVAPTRTLTSVMDPSGQIGLPDIQQDERLYSDDKRYFLVMQGDGNLVGYDNGGNAFWASRSNQKGGPFTAAIQPDGQLVVKNASGYVVWSNKKTASPNPIVVMQGDRNIVGYVGSGSSRKPYWATSTNA